MSPAAAPAARRSTIASTLGIARAFPPRSRARRSRSSASAAGRPLRPSGARRTWSAASNDARVGLLVQRAARRRAPRLERDPERARGVARAQRAQRLVDGGRVVREVVVDAHAAAARRAGPGGGARPRTRPGARARSVTLAPNPSAHAAIAATALRTLWCPGTRIEKRPHETPPAKRSNACAAAGQRRRGGRRATRASRRPCRRARARTTRPVARASLDTIARARASCASQTTRPPSGTARTNARNAASYEATSG